MSQRNDQVFQLSLTEIAFTIAFILLLLLGYLVFKEQSDRKAAEEALQQVQGLERAKAAFEQAKAGLSASLQNAGVPNPDEVISRLVAADEARAEHDRLKTQVDDLNAKLTALTELQKLVESATDSGRQGVAASEVMSALALQSEVRNALDSASQPDKSSDAPSAPAPTPPKQLGEAEKSKRDKEAAARVRQAIRTDTAFRQQVKDQLRVDVKPGQEPQTVAEVVQAAKRYGELAHAGLSPDVIRKENADLRGQVAFLKNKLDARGGRDWPPCWADEDGKVEFLFSVDLRSDTVAVSAAWPAKREADAKALPGVGELLAGPLSYQDFQASVQGVFEWSKRHDPQCRHYVYLRSSIGDAIQSDRARLMVENYFYKAEVRR